MRTAVSTVILSIAALMLAACGKPATNISETTRTDAPKPAASAPAAERLLELDKLANKAYLSGDSEFFEASLHSQFVMHEDGQRLDKAAAIKMIAANKCEVQAWKVEEPRLAKINGNTYVLFYKGTFDGSCIGPDGTSTKLLSPVRAATIWIRSGDQWLAAYHGQNLIIDPKNPRAVKTSGMKSQKTGNPVATKKQADANTAAMMATEKSIWEAWMAKDARKLDGLTSEHLSFMNIFGTYFVSKADTLKDWTGPGCDVTSVSVADGEGP